MPPKGLKNVINEDGPEDDPSPELLEALRNQWELWKRKGRSICAFAFYEILHEDLAEGARPFN